MFKLNSMLSCTQSKNELTSKSISGYIVKVYKEQFQSMCYKCFQNLDVCLYNHCLGLRSIEIPFHLVVESPCSTEVKLIELLCSPEMKFMRTYYLDFLYPLNQACQTQKTRGPQTEFSKPNKVSAGRILKVCFTCFCFQRPF